MTAPSGFLRKAGYILLAAAIGALTAILAFLWRER